MHYWSALLQTTDFNYSPLEKPAFYPRESRSPFHKFEIKKDATKCSFWVEILPQPEPTPLDPCTSRTHSLTLVSSGHSGIPLLVPPHTSQCHALSHTFCLSCYSRCFTWHWAFSRPDFHFCWILVVFIEVNWLMACSAIKGGKNGATYAIILCNIK